jgi:DNA-binding MltR family transcriptional regulator
MIRASKRWISLYALLMITLACLGVYNQDLYKKHNTLIETKEQLIKDKTELRVAANKINGKLPVIQWAKARGMVSVAVLPQEGISAYIPIPSYQPPTTGLELSTVWR